MSLFRGEEPALGSITVQSDGFNPAITILDENGNTLQTIGNPQTHTTVPSVTSALATQPTLRAFESKLSLTGTPEVTVSGSVAALSGATTISSSTEVVGSSFVYGVRGKLIVTGEIDTSAGWQTAIIGQLDISAATLTSQNLSAIWADMGASSGSGATVGTGVDVLRVTNPTALVVNSLGYFEGIATYAFDISDVDATHFVKTAGTPTTSAGQLKVHVNGNVRYIQLFSTSA